MTAATLKADSAAEYVGISKSTLDKLRVSGTGPRFLKLGRLVRYRASDLDEWLASCVTDSTSAKRA